MKKVLIASDHAGYGGKEAIKRLLDQMQIAYADLGPDSESSVDYPDFAERVATGVANGEAEAGILVCGSGIGMQIAANKIAGVRAALAWNEETPVCQGSTTTPTSLPSGPGRLRRRRSKRSSRHS